VLYELIATYIFECDAFLNLEGELRLKLILLVEFSVDSAPVEIDLVVRVRQQLLVDLIRGRRTLRTYDASQLFRKVRRRIVSLNHHEVVSLEFDLENENESHL